MEMHILSRLTCVLLVNNLTPSLNNPLPHIILIMKNPYWFPLINTPNLGFHSKISAPSLLDVLLNWVPKSTLVYQINRGVVIMAGMDNFWKINNRQGWNRRGLEQKGVGIMVKLKIGNTDWWSKYPKQTHIFWFDEIWFLSLRNMVIRGWNNNGDCKKVTN